MPFGMMVALCASGDTTDEINVGTGGADPWTGGMVPPYPKAF